MFLSKAFGGSGTCRKQSKRAKRLSHSFIGIKARGNLSPLVLAESESKRSLKLSTTTKGQTLHQKSCPVQDQLLKEVALRSKVSNGLTEPMLSQARLARACPCCNTYEPWDEITYPLTSLLFSPAQRVNPLLPY